LNRIKVMLVEDEAVVREGYRKLFDWKRYGCAIVSEAGDGLSAVSLAGEYRPDVILMDINIPVMSGLDAIAAIQKQLPSAVFVIISGYNEFNYAQQAIRLGVSDYLLKPVKFEELSAVMQKIRLNILRRGRREGETAEAKRIHKIISYLNDHLEDDISLKKLSEVFYLHPSYLSQFFKTETGMNYHEYLVKLRIERAKQFLVISDLSIDQIAEKTGFGNYRTFSAAFRRVEKSSLSEFRRKGSSAGGGNSKNS
jgi:two-component system response regulator YesN